MEVRIADVDELHSLDIDIPENVEKMLESKAKTMQPLKEWLEFKEDANPRSIKDNIFIRGIISKEKIGSIFWDYLNLGASLDEPDFKRCNSGFSKFSETLSD